MSSSSIIEKCLASAYVYKCTRISTSRTCSSCIYMKFGTIMSPKVATDRSSRSLGYDFVQYKSPHSSKAIDSVNGSELVGKKILPSSRTKKLYRKNLRAEYFTDAKFREIFSAYSPMTSIYIPATSDNTPIGFSFINFQSYEGAKRAVAERMIL